MENSEFLWPKSKMTKKKGKSMHGDLRKRRTRGSTTMPMSMTQDVSENSHIIYDTKIHTQSVSEKLPYHLHQINIFTRFVK